MPTTDRHAATTPATQPFDLADLACYLRRGYLVVPGLLGEAEVDALRQDALSLVHDVHLRPAGEEEGGQPPSVSQAHRHSPLVAELVREPRVVARARQLLDSAVYVHRCTVEHLPRFTGRGHFWRSDFDTWHTEDGLPDPRAVRVVFALSGVFTYNGAPMLIPGSHLRTAGARPQIRRLAETKGIHQVTGAAGDTLWCHPNLVHACGDNITPFPRLTLSVVFNSVDNEPVATG